jgi:mycothiol synthase
MPGARERLYDPSMSDYEIRPMTRHDVGAVNALLAAAEAVDRTEEHYSVEDVVEELENAMIDPSKDWLLAEAGGEVVAQSRLMPRAPDDGAISVGVDGVVHPAHRRRGLGSQLVPLLVQRARDYVRERGEELRPVITGSAPSDNTDLAAIFEKQGLLPGRWAFVMLADLGAEAGASSSALPSGYTLQTWEGIDHDEIRAAHNLAFPGHPGFTPWSQEMWSQWVADSRSFRPALSLLLRDGDGAIAAYLQTSEFDATAAASGIREAFVAKVGTLPAHRRRGLAGLLLQHALALYRQEGFDRAALDVDSENPSGALGIYERAGFRTTRRWTNFELS